jgi:hypothetical protein
MDTEHNEGRIRKKLAAISMLFTPISQDKKSRYVEDEREPMDLQINRRTVCCMANDVRDGEEDK